MKQSLEIRRSTWGRWLVSAVLIATCVRVWLIPGDAMLPRAQAQIPDSGLQRKQLVDAAHRTNDLLAQIVDILGSRTIQVRVVDTDNTGTADGVASNQSRRGRKTR